MKLVDIFTDFLRDTVNLNQTRIDRLEENIQALQSFIRKSNWTPRIKGFEEQGSWAHDTIIKPVDGGEFDADLLVMVDPVEGWSASDYVKTLGQQFSQSELYADKCKVWDYCVTITYAGDRKVDIAPCVASRVSEISLEVCNKKENTFERSEPVEYTKWLKERNDYSGLNSFRKATRLIKYLRDIKTRFTCSSVLLTTLLGKQIEWFDKGTSDFSDTPTTLRTIFARLDDWLQERPYKPRVENPKLSTEDFAGSWTEDQYRNFRSFIHKYRGWIDDAYQMEGRSESIAAWRKVFGDDFAKGEEIKAVKSTLEEASGVKSLLLASAAHLDGLVDVVQKFGLSILPGNFNRPSHMQSPPWKQLASPSSNVTVIAVWHRGQHSSYGRAVLPGDVLPRNGGLWFDAKVNAGQTVPSGYRVQWRITNTGAMAFARRQLRGGFYPPTIGSRLWESLEYRGVHIAEAFIIRMSDDVLVAQSAPFNVVIE
ncbi:nucleotidyltransferase [Mesorhizobium sp. YM1C-6-2]|uniref:SMODS domain-containing nucleotidyltransferase n=1 Tax=Mesorhizobium sp. YM1C-6-2 TaxID=1827501 RepID=UPI000EF19C15|nr:nucleotidyltransferase [Mesorhizobium sp. YM1C-6-2]RLP27598.1 nucleotidyltransferase [Mesorhizobium sp. YM1C-6-2]